MRRRFILTALAGLVGMAACYASASARDFTERWYERYERYRAAEDRYRTRALERQYKAYERHREARDRYRAGTLRGRYNGYERYAGYCDCPEGEYGHGRWGYGYAYGHHYGYHYADYGHYYGYHRHHYGHRRGRLHDRIWRRARTDGP